MALRSLLQNETFTAVLGVTLALLVAAALLESDVLPPLPAARLAISDTAARIWTAAVAACGSPKLALAALIAGTHTLQVRRRLLSPACSLFLSLSRKRLHCRIRPLPSVVARTCAMAYLLSPSHTRSFGALAVFCQRFTIFKRRLVSFAAKQTNKHQTYQTTNHKSNQTYKRKRNWKKLTKRKRTLSIQNSRNSSCSSFEREDVSLASHSAVQSSCD